MNFLSLKTHVTKGGDANEVIPQYGRQSTNININNIMPKVLIFGKQITVEVLTAARFLRGDINIRENKNGF